MAEGAAARFDQARTRCREAGFQRITFRGDTDFSQTPYLDRWDGEAVRFIFGYDASGGLIGRAEALPEGAWAPLVRRPAYAVHTEPRTRPPNVKAATIVARAFKNLRLEAAAVAEFAYTPTACRQPHRMVVVRKNISVEQGTQRLFDQICGAGGGVSERRASVHLRGGHHCREASNVGYRRPEVIKEKYGNLFQMYHKITDENPYEVPMRIYPAIHYTMGGLWVDYNLMSTIPGLHVLGEANFSDHGANRLGASALMQGLADGYFVIPYTIGHYLASTPLPKVTPDHDAFKEAADSVQQRINSLLSVKGNRGIREIHRELGRIMWDDVGMARTEESLTRALGKIPTLREEFWHGVSVPGSPDNLNQSLEYAGRVADYLEFAELLALDALERRESCGGHFREESQTPEGEALRDDEHYSYVAAWEFTGVGKRPELHKEALVFDEVHPTQRSYK